MFLPTNTPNTSKEQIIAMNEALLLLLKWEFNFEKAKQHIVAVRTVFFQPASELLDLAKQRLDHQWDPKPRGWDYFRTPKDTIQKRLTHKYRDGYRYLDEYEDVARTEQLSCEMHRDYDGADETTRAIYTMRLLSVEEGYDNFEDYFDEYFGGSHCTHDYDCCGCWHYHVTSVERISVGSETLFRVKVGGYRNY
jgi:hypothetical protein